jgi:hypothetical protein
MSDFINYPQVLTDMKDAVSAANLGFKTVHRNADDNTFQYQNMPLVDFRVRRATPTAVAGQTYYSDILVEAEIACFDMTSRDKCATMCQGLTNALQRFFQVNPRFGAYVDSTIVGAVEFEVGETKAQGEFVAAAVATFHVLFYSDR